MTFLKSHVYYPHMEQTNTTPEGLIESAHGIEAVLANLYKNFPHLPKTARKVLADIAPWLALISVQLPPPSLEDGFSLKPARNSVTSTIAYHPLPRVGVFLPLPRHSRH